jgi:hypothetical protein
MATEPAMTASCGQKFGRRAAQRSCGQPAGHPGPHTDAPTGLALECDDTEIRNTGQYLGRFRADVGVCSNSWDWKPDPAGDHDGYIHRAAFFCLARTS